MSKKQRDNHKYRRPIWRKYKHFVLHVLPPLADYECVFDFSYLFGWRNSHSFVCSCGRSLKFDPFSRQWVAKGYTAQEALCIYCDQPIPEYASDCGCLYLRQEFPEDYGLDKDIFKEKSVNA